MSSLSDPSAFVFIRVTVCEDGSLSEAKLSQNFSVNATKTECVIVPSDLAPEPRS